MCFKKDIPDFRSYSNSKYYMSSIPEDAWSSLDSLILKSAGDAITLKNVLNSIALISGGRITENWGWDFLLHDVSPWM